MEEFLSVNGTCVTEKIIEKSRFITTSTYADGEEAAKSFISSVRERFADATHNCYAYIADAAGNFLRFSDDGEPSGTAGMPMLEVIKSNNLRRTAVVVTRYFGGIKLGAGGLVRAYSGAVAENFRAAERVCYAPCKISRYEVDYPFADALMRYLQGSECAFEPPKYSSCVSAIVAVKVGLAANFDKNLINRLSGKVKIIPLEEKYFPFKI